MEELIRELIYKALIKAYPALEFKFEKKDIEVNFLEELNLGDYASNVSFILAKKLNEPPIQIAQNLVSLINGFYETKYYFQKIEAVNGFINFFLSSDFLTKELMKILKLGYNYGRRKPLIRKTAVIDYSSPNIAKNFGIGHLRSTVMGNAIYNLYKFLGWRIIGDNHLGDWGTQFGKLLYQIKNQLLKNKNLKEAKIILNNLTIDKLEKLYVEFHKLAEHNPQLEEEARKWFKKLEDKDKEALRIWKKCVEVSLKEFNRIYKILNVKFDVNLGESFYEKKMKEVLKELQDKKLVKESEGALIIEFSKKIPPAIVLKSDKTSTYFLRDLATVKYRLEKWNPSLIIYEVGADQTLYFEQLFEAVRMLNWKRNLNLVHLNHGLMRWPWGKFSTRKGETIHLEEVLNEINLRALKIIENSETRRGLSLKEKKEIAQKIGVSALKYHILSYHYQSDIIFDWDKIMDLEGNSGPYLQYSLARCFNVLNKAKIPKFKKNLPYGLNNEEIALLRQLAKFKSVLSFGAEKFSINLLGDYAYNLASLYNHFYQKHQILKAENEGARVFRLKLTLAVSIVLQIIFRILSIEILKKM
ncbi:MAG: arginine--tRNA ligase [Minisyncoccia bacterium]